jgi:tripartite ATP-independent transporter DctP family solute receptor
MKRALTFVAITVFVMAGLFAIFSDAKAETIDIKLSTIQLRQQQLGQGIERFAKYAQEELKDRVRVRTYPAAQLYTGQEETQAIMKGQTQMAYVIGSSLDMVEPAMQLLNLPYLFPTQEICYRLMDGALGKKLWGLVDKKGIAFLGIVSSGTNIVFNSKRHVIKAEDFKGLKLRSYGPMGASCLKGLGAMSVVTASEETYSALQQGVIDGGITPISVYMVRKYYEVSKYLTNPHMLNASSGFLIASKEWWSKLPDDVRAGLMKAADRLIKEQRVEMAQQEESLFKQAAEKGIQVHVQTPAEEADWKKTLEPVYTEFTPMIGPDLVKETQQAVEKLHK